jgi:hypothetical protein
MSGFEPESSLQTMFKCFRNDSHSHFLVSVESRFLVRHLCVNAPNV